MRLTWLACTRWQKSLIALDSTSKWLFNTVRGNEDLLWTRLLHRDLGIRYSVPDPPALGQQAAGAERRRLPHTPRVAYMLEMVQALETELESIEVRAQRWMARGGRCLSCS